MKTELPFGPFLAVAAVFYPVRRAVDPLHFRSRWVSAAIVAIVDVGGQAAEQIIAGVVLSERLAVTMYGAIHRAQFNGQRNLRGLVVDPKMLAEDSFRIPLTDREGDRERHSSSSTRTSSRPSRVESGGPDVVVVTRGVGRYVTVQDLITAATLAQQAGRQAVAAGRRRDRQVGRRGTRRRAQARRDPRRGAPAQRAGRRGRQRAARRLRRRSRADHRGRAGRRLVAVARARRLHRARARRRRGPDAGRRRVRVRRDAVHDAVGRGPARLAARHARGRAARPARARHRRRCAATRTPAICSRTCSRRSRTIAGSSPSATS